MPDPRTGRRWRGPLPLFLACALAWVHASGCAALRTPPAAALDPWNTNFDGRPWVAAKRTANDALRAVDYVPPGEALASSSELVTASTQGGGPSMPLFIVNVQAGLSQGCLSLVFAVIDQSDTDALYEWRHEGCGGAPAQHALVRAALASDVRTVHSLRYTRRATRMPPEVRTRWLEILRSASLKPVSG
jgi:hypothetical protein